MSVHKSLVSRLSMTRARNVYTRAERVEILTREGRLTNPNQVVNLPKTRVAKAMKKVGKTKEKKAEDAAAVAAPAAGGAKGAPAKAAAPAAKAGAAAPAAKKPAAKK